METRILDGQSRIIDVRGIKIGDGYPPVMIAGPCAVENEEQIFQTAIKVKNAGANILRGGVFKPRTSPYVFQGLGKEGLLMMKKIADELDMPIITELMDIGNLELIYEYADILQIGSRNMYNYPLLKALGDVDKPVMLKRGMSATINEWILAAEYIAAHGNTKIILCERGIRSFETYTRNTLDLSAVPIMKEKTGLPIIVDPSHGTGRRELIKPMSKAALACGADGLMIEVHIQPDKALSDAQQSIDTEHFKQIMSEIIPFCNPL